MLSVRTIQSVQQLVCLEAGCPVAHHRDEVSKTVSFRRYRDLLYLIHSKIPGASLNKVEELRIDEGALLGQNVQARGEKTFAGVSSREATLRLQHLRQLLSTPSVRLDANDIYEALRAITSVTDLATALDLLAEASILEDKLGVVGSTFQKLALALCNETLIAAIKGSTARDVQSNPNVSVLSRKIEYHSQVGSQLMNSFS